MGGLRARAALLVSLGADAPQVAVALSLTPEFAEELCSLPAVKREAEELGAMRLPALPFDLERSLAADARRTFEHMQYLRDQPVDLKVSLGAAKELFDRQAPKRTANDGEKHYHLHLSRMDMTEMRGVVEEVLPGGAQAVIEVFGGRATEPGDAPPE